MPQLERLRVVLAKIESSYGVDPTPSGSSNAILVRSITPPTPLNAEQKDRQLIRPYLANNEQLNANQHSVIEFEVEVAGSGAADTPPSFGPLLRACGLAQTVNAATNVEYAPVSSSFESVTLYFYNDGALHKMTGARGSVSIAISANEIPVMRFRFVGKYNAASAASNPTCDFSSFQKPKVVNNTNTTTFTFYSYSAVLKDLSFDINAQVDFRSLVGSEYVQYTDRKPSGEILIESPALGTKDFFAISQAETTGALQLVHGTATGNKFKLDCSTVDIGNPTYEADNGVVMLKIPFTPLPTSGNDDFKLTFY